MTQVSFFRQLPSDAGAKHHVANDANDFLLSTGDFATMAKYKPQDATTNPSLILAATKKTEYGALLDAAIADAKKGPGSPEEKVDAALDYLLVQFGKKILEIVPGKVSTEVDAALSFDTKASVDKALHIIKVRVCEYVASQAP